MGVRVGVRLDWENYGSAGVGLGFRGFVNCGMEGDEGGWEDANVIMQCRGVGLFCWLVVGVWFR